MPRPRAAETRERIVEQVAPLFNLRGYGATTMHDVVEVTGLEKGGIYNHFRTKEDLALSAYDRNAGLQGELIAERVKAAGSNAVDRLVAIVRAFRDFAHDPPIPGGCPTLNLAVETANVHPRLHEAAQTRMGMLLELVIGQLQRGIARGEIRRDVDPETEASVLAAAVEGALLLDQLFADASHVDRVTDHLERHVHSLAPEA